MTCKSPSSSKAPKIVVELGSGDGRLLKKLVEMEKEDANAIDNNGSLYIGIENNDLSYEKAKSTLEGFLNVILLNGSFEVLIHYFSDSSIDKIISVLPDPEFIDIQNQHQWKRFYSMANSKLALSGNLRIVTELTDDLLQPVSIEAYNVWVQQIVRAFQGLGFSLVRVLEGSPVEYESECLERFKEDPQRIRLATFDFTKKV
jgi:Putative methyltransferase